ncbi:MAG TPA: tRNA (guanosine(46)-N7)-methyltransferase TrmB [Candidatus Kapabacteria bacterium]|nr:tRNA (guanosine(46)-N7)-methyltransferase TrmB [Candidatus Kapabacteria bacterium]
MSVCFPDSCVVAWRNLFRPKALRCEIDWNTEFGNANPLDIEIGMGNGLWLRQFAGLHPERRLVGIEFVGEYVRETSRRAVRDKQSNMRLLCADARLALPLLFEDASLTNIYVNFPDPWFKKRHKKRRLLNGAFLRMLSQKMAVGGKLYVVTDDPEYCNFALESVGSVSAFAKEFEGHHLSELPGYPQTKYERKWRAQGKEIFYMLYTNTLNDVIPFDEYLERQQLQYPMKKLRGEEDIKAIIHG